MKQRVFGTSGVRVSEIGLGCWQMGGSDWGAVSEEDALATLRAAVDSGVNFFDTADVYGLGRSESIIGKFLRDCPEEIFVATKLGRFPEPGWPGNFSLDSLRAHTEASLRRIGVEALDLTQLHCIPMDVLKDGEVFESLQTLQKEGKIRRFGASVESMDEALCCLQQDCLVCLQIIFNIFRQKPITVLFDQAKEKGIALVIRLPLASGLLTGKFSIKTSFHENDHRNYNRDGQSFNVGETFAGLTFEKGVELADALEPMVPRGLTMTQTALRWCLDYDAVSVVIPGARNPQQAVANAAVSELPTLSDQEHERLHVFYETEVVTHIRGPY